MTETTTPEAPPVRVPNVSAGAKSGLSHEVIGANAQAAYDENLRLASEPDADPDRSVGVEIPAGSLEERIAWVSDSEDIETRTVRANAIWDHEVASEPNADHSALSQALRDAVDGTPDVEVPDDLTTVEALLAWVHEPDAHDDQTDRAHAVLAQEGEEGRVTLIKPLTEEYPYPPADDQGTAPTHDQS